MKNLILIRHAKSNWDAPLQDIDRPLDQRGMKDAHLVSLNIQDFIPKHMSYGAASPKELQTLHEFLRKIYYPIECIVLKMSFIPLMKTSRKHHQIL
jgi:phosphohistidine phosphatase